MATTLIELEDGTLVEVDVPEDQAQQISSKFAYQVNTRLDKIKPVLLNICRPLADIWQEMNREMEVEQAEVEVGFNFETEGNIYVAKGTVGSNLTVKLVFKPKALS